MLLALFGVGGFLGNLAIGLIVDRSYRMLAVITPLAIAASLVLMIAASGSLWAIAVVVFVWGVFFASWLLIVNTWIGHRMPDRLEAGGSLVVTGFQAAIMTAAGLGGLLVDALGIGDVYIVGAVSLVVGAVLFLIADRSARRAS
jgi:predicted MFS family arabinose efflux permease